MTKMLHSVLLFAALALTLSPLAQAQGTIASVASAEPSLSTLLKVVKACPPILAATQDVTTAVTVFAPTNDAFASLLKKLNATQYFDKFLANETMVCNVLKYHIVPALVPSSAITNVSVSYPTLLTNSSITVQAVDTRVLVNKYAQVLVPDVAAGKSIVHVINKVLIPPKVWAKIVKKYKKEKKAGKGWKRMFAA